MVDLPVSDAKDMLTFGEMERTKKKTEEENKMNTWVVNFLFFVSHW
jgi:hypothetical protein